MLASCVEIDPYARQMAIEKFGLPDCLHLPIAARTESAIARYVGTVKRVVAHGKPSNALLVEADWPHPVDPRLPIWELPVSSVLRSPLQLWVHVDYRNYRGAFCKAFPDESIDKLAIDHILNRHVARLKGFQYVRALPISGSANSSSGGLSEKWAIEYHKSPAMLARNRMNPAQIQMADLADIVKMLDLKTGGAHQDPVNEAQALLIPRGPDRAVI